ncbi:hypothetical protein EI94DRAFT_1721021 [Lactarius quietus]|nr:hypothetical protein EI94DRAFT_1721021 [Lactarius quietus]
MTPLRYNVISREKRQRLQAGKGVKKNGIYIHDRAASFDVAMDIHKYLPKLNKRAALFRQTQQTIDQRQMEFVALIKAFFEEDVPALIQELRRDRIILDFFGYWRRDYDLANKERAKRPKTASGALETSDISMFSQSSLSLSISSPSASSFTSQVQRSPSSSRWRPRGADSTTSLSDTESAFSRLSRIIPRRNPSSAPAVVVGPISQAQEIASSSNGPSPLSRAARKSSLVFKNNSIHPTFPFSYQFTRDVLSSSRPPHSPTYSTPGLGTLPEDGELGSPISSLPPPTPRNRKDASADRTFRNCMVWNDNDEGYSVEGDALDRELQDPISLSNFSPQSRRSSWRTSSEMAWPASPSSAGSPLDPDFPHWAGTDSQSKPASAVPLIPPQSVDASVPAEMGDGGWSDLGDDFIDTYFGGSESLSVSNEDGNPRDDYDDSGDLPLDVGEDPADRASFFCASVHAHQGHNGVYDDEPPVDISNLSLTTEHASERSGSPHSPSSATTPTLQGVPLGSQMVTVKAILDNSIVVFRARRDMPLADLRRRVHDKFVRTEGIALHGAFALAYLSPFDSKGARRVSSASGDSSSCAMPIQIEEDWADAVADCGLKITLRVYYPS